MLSFRKSNIKDINLYFNWVNDTVVRKQSYSSEPITFKAHSEWFNRVINDDSCSMFVFINDSNEIIGQLRIQKTSKNESTIGISIDSNHRGKGYATEILLTGTKYFFLNNPSFIINAFIKQKNLKSKYAFEKAGFIFKKSKIYENSNSFHYIKYNNEN